jgi:hypothetical protein
MSDLYICTKCKAESVTGEDHPTDLDCATRWRSIAAMALTPVMVAKKKMEACRAMRHRGQPILINGKGEAMDYCSKCIAAVIAAFRMQERYIGFFSSSQEAGERGPENGGEQQAKGIGKSAESTISEDDSAHPETGRESREVHP